jgi:ATP-dependent Clp protease ATP-binding subunit ClpX
MGFGIVGRLGGDEMVVRKVDTRSCSFCGRAAGEVRRLIAGEDGVFICDRCVLAASEMIDRHAGKPAG